RRAGELPPPRGRVGPSPMYGISRGCPTSMCRCGDVAPAYAPPDQALCPGPSCPGASRGGSQLETARPLDTVLPSADVAPDSRTGAGAASLDPAGTSRVTTTFAPMIVRSPIVTGPATTAPQEMA